MTLSIRDSALTDSGESHAYFVTVNEIHCFTIDYADNVYYVRLVAGDRCLFRQGW